MSKPQWDSLFWASCVVITSFTVALMATNRVDMRIVLFMLCLSIGYFGVAAREAWSRRP